MKKKFLILLLLFWVTSNLSFAQEAKNKLEYSITVGGWQKTSNIALPEKESFYSLRNDFRIGYKITNCFNLGISFNSIYKKESSKHNFVFTPEETFFQYYSQKKYNYGLGMFFKYSLERRLMYSLSVNYFYGFEKLVIEQSDDWKNNFRQDINYLRNQNVSTQISVGKQLNQNFLLSVYFEHLFTFCYAEKNDDFVMDNIHSKHIGLSFVFIPKGFWF